MLITLYFPLMFSGSMFYLFIKLNFGKESVFSIQRYGFTFNFTRNFIGKTVILALVLSFIPTYIRMDMVKYYPQKYNMEVFFEKNAIENALKEFTNEELKNIGFDKTKPYDPQPYYNLLDKARENVTGRKNGFFSGRKDIFSRGSTTYLIRKISGFQRYHLDEAEGQLVHDIIRVDGEINKFRTFFSLRTSAGDFFEPSLKDILLKRYFITSPKFSQSIASYDNSEGQQIYHTLRGITKVYIWPIPKNTSTIYFYTNKAGYLVPVGVAKYY